MHKLLAALSFFTRLPFWRLARIPDTAYRRVVDLWPAAGWVTGGITALSLLGALLILPPVAAVIVAFSIRVILTGALHEDGLADFIDGMGGGMNRTRILEIMKDSHIGSYGVIGLIMYFLLLVACVSSFPQQLAPVIVLAADPWSKFCASFLVNTLPYARKQEEAKNKLIYERMTIPAFILCFLFGFLPSLTMPLILWPALLISLVLAGLIIIYLKHKIGGYTGDCCGATALLCELSFYFSCAITCHLSI